MTMTFSPRIGGLVVGFVFWLAPFFLQAEEPVASGKGVLLPRSGQISTFDQAGKLIDPKGTGQDGDFQRGLVWPEPRFIVNDDGTLSDFLTGLMWIKDGNCFGELPWTTALQTVASFNQGKMPCHDFKTEHHDWFLPDVNQLASLLDAESGAPADYLRLVGLAEVQNGVYWSATPYLNRLNAWGVDFQNGSIALRNKLEKHFLFLARIDAPEKNGVAQSKVGIPGPGGVDKPQSGASRRFVDNGDGTVTDGMTGLMWLQDGSCLAGLDWQGALAAMQRLNGAQAASACKSLAKQYTDWTLPNAIELRSLMDYEADYPALSSGHPFRTALSANYWTATTVAALPAQAFVVDFATGALLGEPKTTKHHALAVRPVVAVPERPRKVSERGGNLGVAAQFLLTLDPNMSSEIRWPPVPRFHNNGDGTSLDTITGINWLTDANCFGKLSWKEAATTLQRFNAAPKQYKCADYDAGNDDWQLPTLAEMRELVNADAKNPLEWLNQQGLKNVQGGSIYWTATETPLNLYYADGIVLKTGKAGNYPKSLKFSVWPMRMEQKREEGVDEPLLNVTANAIDNLVSLSPDDPLSLVVYLHTFGLRTPSDFWFWYDTPDEKHLWLTATRTWTNKPTPVYQGPLFNLKNYEIYRSPGNGLVPGVYDFHFAVDTVPNGIYDEPHFEIKLSVVIVAGSQE